MNKQQKETDRLRKQDKQKPRRDTQVRKEDGQTAKRRERKMSE